jgi:hypothetical protein
MQKYWSLFVWFLPLSLHSGEAFAWGLYTHVYFAQLLVWAIPLLDPKFRRAARSFPKLVLAGACLPDLALTGKYFKTTAFDNTHQWTTAQAVLENAHGDEEHALALGFASHLFVDIIAHNHFVPAHETMWADVPLMTHVVSEWAMDAHLAPQLFETPAQLIHRHLSHLSEYAADTFSCDLTRSRSALVTLARADRVLRRSGIPKTLLIFSKTLDHRLVSRFDYYIKETNTRLHQINRVLQGHEPAWQPELLCVETKRKHMRQFSKDEIQHRLPLPLDLFEVYVRE